MNMKQEVDCWTSLSTTDSLGEETHQSTHEGNMNVKHEVDCWTSLLDREGEETHQSTDEGNLDVKQEIEIETFLALKDAVEQERERLTREGKTNISVIIKREDDTETFPCLSSPPGIGEEIDLSNHEGNIIIKEEVEDEMPPSIPQTQEENSEESSNEEPLHIRLTGSSSVPYEGRVEVYYDGEWGPMCDGNWTANDAEVVCRTLGYANSSTTITGSGSDAEGTSEWGGDSELDDGFVSDNMRCVGDEKNIASCPRKNSNFHTCNQNEVVRVACDGIVIRLEGGSSKREGRVELYQQGSWGTICDNSFGLPEANVVCRMLGFAFAERYYVREPFGPGTGDILVDEMECTGDESNIDQCSPRINGTHNCTHERDVGVNCTSLPVRLADGNSSNEGRVEVFFEESWGTICDDNWFFEGGNVVCRMLGYRGVDSVNGLSVFGRATGKIVLDNFLCSGMESHIAHCTINDGYGNHDCDHKEDSGVVCSGEATTRVRLRDGPDPSQGRLELFVFGAWGTACRKNWTSVDSSVVCRNLGYFGAADTLSSPSWYAPGAGMVLMREPRCKGKESDLLQCDPAYPLGVTSCDHHDDVWVSCLKKDNLEVRLVGGHNGREGRVEVFHRGRWGTVCDDNWDILDSTVVCKMLGFDAAEHYYSCCARFKEGSGNIILDEVQCNGTEENIGHCMRQDYGVHDCDHSEDVGVSCIKYDSTTVSVRPTEMTEGPVNVVTSPLSWLSTGLAVFFFLLFLISVAALAYTTRRILHYRGRAAEAKRDLRLQPLSRAECSNSYAKSFTKASCSKHPETEVTRGDSTFRGTAEYKALPAKDIATSSLQKPGGETNAAKQVQVECSEATRPDSEELYEAPPEIYEVPLPEETYEDVMVARLNVK